MDLSNFTISELEGTFNKDKVDSITINITKDAYSKTGMSCAASIRFANGNTSGRHAIGSYDNPTKLIEELKQFISALK